MKLIILISFLILCVFVPLAPAQTPQTNPSAQTPPPQSPCSADEKFRQFDFWVGEWDVSVKGKVVGKNNVQLILDKCVIFENWTSGRGHSGKSFNIYHNGLNEWQQFWVDDTAGVVFFHGQYENHQMKMIGETRQSDGSMVQERMTYFDLGNRQIRQVWEQSSDNGKTWTVAFDGHYTPSQK